MKVLDKEQQEIFDFIKRSEEISQPEIIRYFSACWFVNDSEANKRVKIGSRLKTLERHGLIEKFNKQKTTAIPTNYWRIKHGVETTV